MYEADRTHVVLVVAREDVLSNLRDAFCDTNFALLHAHTIQEGIALLERLKSQIDIAIVQLELQELAGWDMISQLTRHPQRPVQIIATISTFSLPLVQKAKELGID